MKAIVLTTALLALAITPAAAQAKKKRVAPPSPPSIHAQASMPGQHPHGIYMPDGELIGMDPDPFIRLMMRKDPKPSEASGI